MLSLEYVKSLVTQFKANEDGNIAMMMGVGVLVLVASVGLAIDTLGARNAKQELQSHLDVISMAIVTSGICLLYTSPSPRDRQKSRMPSSA